MTDAHRPSPPSPTDGTERRSVTPAPSAPLPDRLPDLWATVDEMWAWLEAHDAPGSDPDRTLLLRLLKLSEEAGEVAQAVIGVTGHNPRKGVTHTWQDVEAELCDVAITALIALRTLTPEARTVFARHLARVRDRCMPQPARPDTPAASPTAGPAVSPTAGPTASPTVSARS
jgi:NTP pyrophosphatase (non-canonical NTP hydrolase)